jgi:hypothetical protein
MKQRFPAFALQRQQFIERVGQDARAASLKGIFDHIRQTRAANAGKYLEQRFAEHLLGR